MSFEFSFPFSFSFSFSFFLLVGLGRGRERKKENEGGRASAFHKDMKRNKTESLYLSSSFKNIESNHEIRKTESQKTRSEIHQKENTN